MENTLTFAQVDVDENMSTNRYNCGSLESAMDFCFHKESEAEKEAE